MDLVAGVRKEGSRGGRANFKWEDVKDDQHRENYLGHSLMAPVGRWQKNRDLSWYAKSDKSDAAIAAAEARADEIRRIKEAEQDALSEALGYGPVKRNPNTVALGQRDIERAIKETTEGHDENELGKGIGFGVFGGNGVKEEGKEMMAGIGLESQTVQTVMDKSREEKIQKERRRGSNSRDRSRDRRHRLEDGGGRSHRRRRSRHRSRDRFTERYRHSHRRVRSRSYERRRDDDLPPRRPQERDYSPDYRRRRQYSRDRDLDRRR